QDHPFVSAWDPAGKWGAPAQIDVNVFSPAVAGLAASATEMLVVYGGGDDNPYRVRYANGPWPLPAVRLVDANMMSEQTNKSLTPGVAALDAGGFLVVFQDKASGTALRWSIVNGATNTPSQPIFGASSSAPVALAPIAGGAVLAFRDANG